MAKLCSLWQSVKRTQQNIPFTHAPKNRYICSSLLVFAWMFNLRKDMKCMGTNRSLMCSWHHQFPLKNWVELFLIIFRKTSETNSDLSSQTILLWPIRSTIKTNHDLAHARFPALSLHAFSRALRQLHVLTAVSDWLIPLSTFAVTGQM